MPNSVWKRVHRTAPHLIHDLLAPLVTYGSHPLTLKRADGIVLDKPGKRLSQIVTKQGRFHMTHTYES